LDGHTEMRGTLTATESPQWKKRSISVVQLPLFRRSIWRPFDFPGSALEASFDDEIGEQQAFHDSRQGILETENRFRVKATQRTEIVRDRQTSVDDIDERRRKIGEHAYPGDAGLRARGFDGLADLVAIKHVREIDPGCESQR